jgi:hypothetical protein
MVSNSSELSRDAALRVYDLKFAHRYGEAISIIKQQMAKGEQDWHGSLGEMYLCDRQYANAAEAFGQANRDADKRDRPRIEHMGLDPAKNRTGTCLSWLGTAYWLAEEHDLAKSTWRGYVEGNLAGEIIYGDAAGGVTEGLLLWYASLLTQDDKTCKDALNYLVNRSKHSAIKSWPGPLAMMILGKRSKVEVLAEQFKTNSVESAITAAKTDLLKRRHLSNYFLYVGALALNDGKEDEYWNFLKLCAAMENPIIEDEWYIARGAVERQ